MSHKTKATPKDRQCGNTKPVQINSCPAGGQNQDYENQPFGSMPRCCSSLRIIRFIQAARDSSPSSSCAVSIISRNSGSKRNWKGGFPRLSFLCVDTSITPCVEYECVMTHYTRVAQNATPRSVPALPRRLTTNQPESIEVAMRNNNTQREKILPFTVCNAYVQCKAWCSLFAVFVHISANSMTHHASCNGTVCSKRCVGLTPIFLTPMNAPRRPSMVLLVGERSRSLANLLAGLPIPASDTTSTAVKKCLRTYNGLGYVYPAPAKSGVGISLPEITIAHNTRLACFFVPHSHTLSMVGCMGAEQSAPGSIVTGKANPVQSATSKISLFSGGNIKPTIEDAAMLATTPTQNPLFVWRFFSCQQSTYHTVTATSEREARSLLSDSPCLFAARLPVQEVHHA